MPEQAPLRVAVDTGGTFTDCVTLRHGELRVLKLPSTPHNPAEAVLAGIARLYASDRLPGRSVELRHGTTVGTNTMLERTGARVAFVTTAGFEDTIAIGRQTRSRLYDWFAPVPVCLVPPSLRFGVPERVSAEGKILLRPSDEDLADLAENVRASGAESVALSLLFAFANTETEKRVESALLALGIPVSAAHRILPEFREYERASTTVVNAYLAPRMAPYLEGLAEDVSTQHDGGQVKVMQSSGGMLSAAAAAREPVRTVLSGPAGGVVGACRVARWAGIERIIGFDMGGTSTDVFLADSAGAPLTRESQVAGIPIGVPMLDIHTAGAGGGSIARFDGGGLLRVGPESAGADPGPICFCRGTRATVTDANFLLGRLDPETFLDGAGNLDREATERLFGEQKGSLATIHDFAAGILRVVESSMEKAIRVISIDRGRDPRDYTLVAFGGGGPLHACALASKLRIRQVLIPSAPGALSAMGILLADSVRDDSQTVMLPGEAIGQLGSVFADLEARAHADFAADGLVGNPTRTVDLRYQSQGYELNVPWDDQSPQSALESFHSLHRERYGFSDNSRAIEIVNVRLRLTAAAEPYTPARKACLPGDGRAACYAERDVYLDGQAIPSRFYHRTGLVPGDVVEGPAMITEYTSATLLHPSDRAAVDGFGNLLISIHQEDAH